jgi:DNA-binding NarL/FixJ family response regulator
MVHDEASPLNDATLLLIDRHRLFREAIVPHLRRAKGIREVIAVGGLDEAAALAEETTPHVVLMDPHLSIRGPTEAAKRLKELFPQSQLVLLDDQVRAVHVRVAIALDAAGYWTKRDSLKDLIQAIRRIHTGQKAFCAAVAHHFQETEEHQPNTVPAIDRLTEREFEVFSCLARGMTIPRCAEQLKIATSTVVNHKARVMKKLDVHKANDLTWVAIREGLLHTPSA